MSTSETPRRVDRRSEFPKFQPREAPPSFGGFVEAVRDLLDLSVAADADDAAYAAAAAQVREAVDTLEPYREVKEGDGPANRVSDLPGRGSAMQTPWRMVKFDESGVRSLLRFRRAHVGGNNAAHGGMIANVFDEHLGWIVYSGGHPLARTAYLNVSYWRVAPVGPELIVDGWVDRVEGRKIYVAATLSDQEGNVLAECKALMIGLLEHHV
ncbi:MULTISPECIES: PaaI family thioesterase [Tsukamurella]|uniref:Acyl-coenzyme A thioesterase THEM4 n=1 Tax=Tsukamurella strandjordii TaxID=147577 RepID=A0AA90NHI4_9ACTN|nr:MULTISPECIES: PaaI family thioesterase [Tsukamurella]MDP0398426.1 PaaI family thioesterase [Tsukamurella strandjordii]GIZ97715.1 thioesterase [Tsukamurella sp. TY48]